MDLLGKSQRGLVGFFEYFRSVAAEGGADPPSPDAVLGHGLNENLSLKKYRVRFSSLLGGNAQMGFLVLQPLECPPPLCGFVISEATLAESFK